MGTTPERNKAICPGILKNTTNSKVLRILADKFSEAGFLGIDASLELLLYSNSLASECLRFNNLTVEGFLQSYTAQHWDLIFSNAALQWVDGHKKLFHELLVRLSDEG